MNDDLKNFSDKLRSLQEAHAKSDTDATKKDSDSKEKDAGFGAGMELVVNMIAGGIVGYGIDHFSGTMPLFMILFFLIGFGWGMYRVYKITEKLDNSE